MSDFVKFLSTAPVTLIAFSSLILTVFILINYVLPDVLAF